MPEKLLESKSLLEVLPSKKYHRELSETLQRHKALNFLLFAYGLLLLCTVAIFILQGFHVSGFSLDSSLLNWLGGATVGEIAGLASLVYGALFRRDSYFIIRELIRLYEDDLISEDTFKEIISSDNITTIITEKLKKK